MFQIAFFIKMKSLVTDFFMLMKPFAFARFLVLAIVWLGRLSSMKSVVAYSLTTGGVYEHQTSLFV